MQEKDYCKKCHLYTSQKVEKEVEDNKNTELWYCLVCDTHKTYLK